MKIIRHQDLREGRWRNGMGVSWDIASDSSLADGFGWRLSLARIDRDVPFSVYPGVDRIFTLVEGGGVDLDLQNVGILAAHSLYTPYPFPCDVPAQCRLRAGPCRALNLFTRRQSWSATADVLSGAAEIAHDGPILLYALSGDAEADGVRLEEGDAVVAEGQVAANTTHVLLAARLWRE